MKLKNKIISVFITVMIIASQTAFAEPLYLYMSGKTTDTDVIGATVLVVDKGTNRSEILAGDIKYIGQGEVSENGTFSFALPFMNENDYDFYSNFDFNLGAKTKTVYVSDEGNDSNTGDSPDSPYKTIAKAYERFNEIKEIVISGTVDFENTTIKNDETLTIKGATSSAVLNLPETINLTCPLTLSNLKVANASTIYANGYHFTVESTVESVDTANRMVVYGGSSAAYTGDTHITLLGGSYGNVFGGGKGDVTGNTYITIGGNANKGDSIDDDDTTNFKKDYRVYGGGNGAVVTGSSNITLKGNAVCSYMYATGKGTGATVTEGNINIQGGSVAQIIGFASGEGSIADINVTVTGGTIESIFGGANSANVGGSVNINLLGGNITRRIYGGCYNNTSGISYSTTAYFDGPITIVIEKNVNLISGNPLSSDNSTNMGVFPGSRIKSENTAEKKAVVYLDDCYSTFSGKIGEQATDIGSSLMKPNATVNYTIKASGNGKVSGTNTAGSFYINPDYLHFGTVNSEEKPYYNENATLSAGTHTVTFTRDFTISGIDASASDSKVNTDVSVTAKNPSGENNPRIIVALYDPDDNDRMLDVAQIDTKNITGNKASFEFDYSLASNKTYHVKAFIWTEDGKALTASYSINLRK
ncbi:MAG: hypothetical protein E7396_04755 [Ruminococcaceae bacterium]|nr:hypothetical protein [Oscillospiraceae bacterium]